MEEKLWSPNFKRMFVGWILSAMGGIGFHAAFGLVVFDNTQSTLLSGIFVALSMIPSILLPLIIAPYIDRQNPLKVLLRNEKYLLVVFIIAYIYVSLFSFNYLFYLMFSLIIACLGVISDLATQSLSASLMPKALMSKGYAILSAISPFTSFIITPIAILLYSKFGMPLIFMMYILFTACDIAIESRIDYVDTPDNQDTLNQSLLQDIKESFKYLNQNKDIKLVFIFFSFVMFSSGTSQLIYPYFQSQPHLDVNAYALFASLSASGYLFGAIFHYFVEIPRASRFRAAITIYLIYIILESSLLLVSLPLMYGFKVIMGVLGMNSANIRNSAVQSKLDPAHRAKMNALFSIMSGLGTMIGNMVFGFLAEYIPIPVVVIMAQLVYLGVILIIVLPNKNTIKPLYNLEHLEA